MRLALLTVVAALGLATPPAAAAAGWTVLPTPASVASDHWPDSVCHGHEQIVLVTDVEATTIVGHSVSGYAGVDDLCTVHMVHEYFDRAPRSEQCAMLMHEFGHLSGLGHSSAVNDVMNGEHLFVPHECKQFDVRLTKVVPRQLRARAMTVK